MKAVIVDDEPLARARLVALLGECEGVQVLADVADGEAALAACAGHRPDLLLLDISMPGLDGTQLARRLGRLPSPPQVVFCTAYPQHAAEAFDLGVADYLVKPVRLERLREALVRVRKRLAQQTVRASAGPALTARLRGEEQRIPLSEVICLLADEKYVTVHHEKGESLIEDSLRMLERAWPDLLLRVHRNCLVASARLIGLRTLEGGRVVVRLAGTGLEPEVSRRNLASVRRCLRDGS